MIDPAMRADEADWTELITKVFAKDPEAWTADDLTRVIARYRECMAYMRELGLCPKTPDPKIDEPKPKRRKKVDPRQSDLFDKEAGET